MSCPICKSYAKLHSSHSFFDVYSCTLCSTLFAHPLPSDKDILSIYNQDYTSFKGSREMKRKTFASILDNLEKFTFLKNKRLLDVGCGPGYLLEEATLKQMETFGVDIISQKKAINIFHGTLTQANFPANSFDMITMVDVLEHLKDPLAQLKAVKKILKKGGLLVIVTPNKDSLWLQIKKEHLFYFSSKSIQLMADKIGFSIIDHDLCLKFLTLDYLYSYFQAYPILLITPISLTIPYLPRFIRTYPFPFMTDDLLIVLQNL